MLSPARRVLVLSISYSAPSVSQVRGEKLGYAPLIRLRHLLPAAAGRRRVNLLFGYATLVNLLFGYATLVNLLFGHAKLRIYSPSPPTRCSAVGEKVPKADEGGLFRASAAIWTALVLRSAF